MTVPWAAKRAALLSLLATAWMVARPISAQAQYVDPGTSGILIQVLIAGVVGFLTVLKVYWGRISSFFSKRSRQQPGPPSA